MKSAEEIKYKDSTDSYKLVTRQWLWRRRRLPTLSVQQSNCPNSRKSPSTSLKDKRSTPEEFIASQPLQNSDLNVWGVLTAISTNARKRRQGINVLLAADEHYTGRVVQDRRFQIEANSVSGKHCGIFRRSFNKGDADHQSNGYVSVYLKDTSANGTFLNWEKLTKDGPEAELRHGDIVSFVSPPHLGKKLNLPCVTWGEYTERLHI